ncbi:hypothetical protein BIW11_12942 [Tropilaelaps mercedesae]|uniref:Uncharacterized protein n=1 Tax=Tropilaelaps mercedesae TaxID=418985 RepID=A0A1V9X4T9_9ACAR|nr:hypothetical protein BIW11_12942 [Tropilaelaps mercedesae]
MRDSSRDTHAEVNKDNQLPGYGCRGKRRSSEEVGNPRAQPYHSIKSKRHSVQRTRLVARVLRVGRP